MIVAVCEPTQGNYSETFIRAHIDHLPGRVLHLHGDWPLWTHNEKRIIPIAQRAALRFRGKLPASLGRAAEKTAQGALARYLSAKRVDVVLAEYGTTAVSLIAPCRMARIPLVAHFHGFDAYHRDILAEHREAYGKLFEMAAAIVAVSRDMAAQLASLGAPPEKIQFNSCGVDLSAFQPSEPAEGPPEFVSVGRFVDKKAPHLTILAFQRVLAEVPEARLTMIGDGYLWDACRQMVTALSLGDRVQLAGRKKPEEVSAAMRRARAFVQHSVTTSYGDSEGTPVAVLEASASALPVVATRHAGIKEAVIDETSGLLVEECDVEGMARHMIRLAKDKAAAVRMGLRGREHMAEWYAMEKRIATLGAILQSAADGRTAP